VRIAVSAGGVLNLGQQPAVTDAFAVKYDSSGSVLYGTYFGGGATVQNTAVLAPNGHLLMAGSTGDGLPVVNPFQAQFRVGATDGFLAELERKRRAAQLDLPGRIGNRSEQFPASARGWIDRASRKHDLRRFSRAPAIRA
jgi:hypothetical protein